MDVAVARNNTLKKRCDIASVVAVICIAVIAAFGASVRHGFSMLDDPYLVVSNLAIRGPTPAHVATVFTTFDPELYIPLTLVSYQLNYLVAGLQPWIYHVTNIALHAGNAVLVAVLAYLLLKRKWTALVAGMLFAVHPLHTEAVAWVAGRKDLLSAFFALLTMIAYVRWRHGGRRSMYWLSVTLYLLALLSKASVVVLPALLLFIDWLIDGRRDVPRMLVEKTPHVALAMVFATVAAFAKTRIIAAATISETALMAAKSTVFYLKNLFWPSGLTPLYPYNGPVTLASGDFWLPLLVIALLSVGVVLLWKRWRMGAFAWSWFLLCLAPSFLNFHKGEVAFFAVDRYAYLGSIGIILGVVAFASSFTVRWESQSNHRWKRRATVTLVAVPVLLLLALARGQTATWSSDETVLSRSLALYPDSIPARTSLSVLYRETGRPEAEEQVIRSGLQYRDDVEYRVILGSINARRGLLKDAEAEFLRAEALNVKNPEPAFYLGALREQEGKTDLAVNEYRRAVALDPSYAAALINLAGIEYEQSNFTGSELHLRQALSYNPNIFEAQYTLFQSLEAQGKSEEAIVHLETAYELNSSSVDVLTALTYRLVERGRGDEAERILLKAIRDNPENRSIRRMLEYVRSKG